jgi:hypothetical protein
MPTATPQAQPTATVRTPRVPSRPPAISAAFARQGAWKNWVLLLQFALNFLLVVAAIGFSRKEPDVVLVEPDGKSTYVNRSIAGEALTRFLTEQRHQPSDVTVVHFTRTFLNAFLAINSSTVDAAWPEALAMMDASLRDRVSREAKSQKLLETYRLARVKTDITIEDLVLIERHPTALHVRATVTRRKQDLLGSSGPTTDKLQVDVVERVVPRTPSHPDGLEVVEYRNTLLPN